MNPRQKKESDIAITLHNTQGMNDVRLHVPYIFGNKQNSKKDRESEEEQKAQLKTEKFGTKRGPQ